jgi:tellurite resistance protein TerC
MKSVRDGAALLSPLTNELEILVITSYRQARKAAILVLGSSILLIGVAMILLPGPAVLLIPLGLSILAVEFAWARRWLRQIKMTIAGGQKIVGNVFGRDRQPGPKE